MGKLRELFLIIISCSYCLLLCDILDANLSLYYRSPSPEPIYNNEGKRLNTREYRTRKKLEEERHKLVNEAMSLNLDYKPPADYK